MERGDVVPVRFGKWGGRPHWEMDLRYLGSDGFGDWLGSPAGMPMRRPGMDDRHRRGVRLPRPPGGRLRGVVQRAGRPDGDLRRRHRHAALGRRHGPSRGPRPRRDPEVGRDGPGGRRGRVRGAPGGVRLPGRRSSTRRSAPATPWWPPSRAARSRGRPSATPGATRRPTWRSHRSPPGPSGPDPRPETSGVAYRGYAGDVALGCGTCPRALCPVVVTGLVSAEEQHKSLPMPTIAYGVIAFVAFLLGLGVLWTFRNTAAKVPTKGRQQRRRDPRVTCEAPR